MKKLLSLFGATALLLAPVALGSAGSTTDVLQERNVPVLIISDCTGDVVNATAHIVVRVHQTFNAGGGINSRLLISIGGSGSDAFGNTFSFNVQERAVASTSNGKGQSEVSQSITANLIGRGGALREKLHGLVHFTIAANGALTANVDNLRSSCS